MGGAYPFTKIYFSGERPHEVRCVPPRLFARCGLAERLFEHLESIVTSTPFCKTSNGIYV